MTKRFVAALAAGAVCLMAAVALAETPSHIPGSGEGGYLGRNPGSSVAVNPSAPPQSGSQQGGYLGLNAGRNLQSARITEADVKASPTAWCYADSVEPDRCAGRAQPDHAWCLERNRDGYAICRRAMDFIGWHN